MPVLFALTVPEKWYASISARAAVGAIDAATTATAPNTAMDRRTDSSAGCTRGELRSGPGRGGAIASGVSMRRRR